MYLLNLFAKQKKNTNTHTNSKIPVVPDQDEFLFILDPAPQQASSIH